MEESRNTFGRSPVHKRRTRLFEETVLPHLDAAYNLARWLTRNDHDAQDVVQESYLRAFQAFDGFQRGRDARPWMLKIVRNTCYTWLRANRPHEIVAVSDETWQEPVAQNPGPEASLIRDTDSQIVRRALEDVQLEYREALVLRELEELSYREIAELLGVPLGTVMSRLSRGRRDLSRLLQERARGATK
ncbi:MAG: sigma-70 family RNA polymerase sigma factor [Acidobacteriaceae bacterium]|nr:sigma-70 family RNA polymerase sigma factor [Acidobacteriaceae bacterium]